LNVQPVLAPSAGINPAATTRIAFYRQFLRGFLRAYSCPGVQLEPVWAAASPILDLW
jgi:hypothetical protein